MRYTVLLIALASCVSTGPKGEAANRRVAAGEYGAIATANAFATEAGLEVLRAGGTAIDAAIASALVLGVAEPYSAGLGGGGFALVHDAASGKQTAVDFRETAPAAASRDMYLDRQGAVVPKASLDGWKAIAVPGTVHGLETLYRLKRARPAALPWHRLVAPAQALAAKGFTVSPLLHDRIVRRREALGHDVEASRLFLPAGTPLPVGATLVQRNLAKTLEAIAVSGADALRRGEIAQNIVAAAQAGGGLLSEADLLNYRVVTREPLRGTYRGKTIVSFPPPSSGGVHLLQMLDLLGRQAVPKDPMDPDFLHRRVEVMRRAYQDRARHLGDPEFYPVPVDGLLSKQHLDALASSITDKPTPSKSLDNPQPPGAQPAAADAPRESPSTTHLSVVDRWGNAVSMTFTINYGFGAAVIAPGTGILLNDEMDDFSAAPGQPNAYGLVGGEANSIEPGKRPLSSMTPTIVLDEDGGLMMAIGSPGGSTIITTVLQVVLHVIDRQLPLGQAIAQARTHHQWLPDCIMIDGKGHRAATIDALKARGHCVKSRGSIGNAHGVLRRSDGLLEAAADPRGEGTAGALTSAPPQ